MSQTINIVIPMAGEGSRFQAAGYSDPKPFIDVEGKPMIERVLDNLSMPGARFILIARQDHLDQRHDLAAALTNKYDAEFVTVDQLTEGTACTVLFSRHLINNDTPLLIANSDQIVDCSMSAFIAESDARHLDGSILTFVDSHRDPKWSFAKCDDDGLVVEVKEKVAISDTATVGIYYFNKGSLFVNSAIDMIVRNDRVNNEFYTCPTYNYAIQDGANIGIYNIDYSAMHGIGTPDDLAAYVNNILAA